MAKTATPEQPDTIPRFAAWIDEQGAAKVAEWMGVTKWTVYGWRRGSVNIANGRTASASGGIKPEPGKLGELIKLAKGHLNAADIFPPRPKR